MNTIQPSFGSQLAVTHTTISTSDITPAEIGMLSSLSKGSGYSSGFEALLRPNNAVERRLQEDPDFRQLAERLLGGKIVLDGKIDGDFEVRRTNTTRSYVAPRATFTPNNMLADSVTGAIRQAAAKLEAQGQASSAGKQDSVLNDPNLQSVLNDPNASLEDKILAFTLATIAKVDREIEELLSGGNGEASKPKSKKSGGPFGFLKNAVSGAVNAVGGLVQQAAPLAGAAAGGMLGGPIGAMIGSSIASEVAGGVFSSEATSGSSSGGKSMSDEEIGMRMQQLQNKKQRMVTMATNLLQTMQSINMAIIGNLRG